MNPGEMLSMITARSAPFERMPTGIPEISQADLLAAMGMIKHPYATIYCRVKYAGQLNYWDKLLLETVMEVSRLWDHNHWPMPKDRDILDWLNDIANMALIEHIWPHVCQTCNGTGFTIINAKQIRRRRKRNVKIGQVIECLICKSTGHKKPTGRSRAAAMCMAPTTWIHKWDDRYRDVLIVLDKVEAIGLGSIVNRLR